EDDRRPHDVDAVVQERRHRDAQQRPRRGRATDRQIAVERRRRGIEHKAVEYGSLRLIPRDNTVGLRAYRIGDGVVKESLQKWRAPPLIRTEDRKSTRLNS